MQALTAPANGAEELVEVDLEGRQDRVRPILHLQPRFTGLAAGVLDDLLGLSLGELDDLRLRCLAYGVLPGLPVGTAAVTASAPS